MLLWMRFNCPVPARNALFLGGLPQQENGISRGLSKASRRPSTPLPMVNVSRLTAEMTSRTRLQSAPPIRWRTCCFGHYLTTRDNNDAKHYSKHIHLVEGSTVDIILCVTRVATSSNLALSHGANSTLAYKCVGTSDASKRKHQREPWKRHCLAHKILKQNLDLANKALRKQNKLARKSLTRSLQSFQLNGNGNNNYSRHARSIERMLLRSALSAPFGQCS